jgi:hypothetical protein
VVKELIPKKPGRGWKKGTGTICRNGPEGAAHKWCLSPFSDELASGPKRNFQIFDPLDFLAEFTQHIPPKGAHLIRYYGWYSNKSRGMRRKAAAEAAAEQKPSSPGAAPAPALGRCSQTWAMLIKRVYEIDPLACPQCGGRMKVIAFIEPPQGVVIEKILRHCGLWNASSPRAPPAVDDRGLPPWSVDDFSDRPIKSSDEQHEWTYIDIDTFEATF